MFEKLTCFASAEFELCAAGPVLVSSGRSHKTDPDAPDATFMTGYVGKDHSEECYVIPGSSIKGVLRHHIRDFYITSDREEEELFGKITGGSRKSKVRFSDAFAVSGTVVASVRYSTRIDPNTQGAVRNSLHNMEAVEEGTFNAGFRIVNFSHKEIESLLMALLDINEGIVRFGGRVSRGFGQMRIGRFSMTADKGYDIELRSKDRVTFSGIEDAVKYFREAE